jgi:hypothetical protein
VNIIHSSSLAAYPAGYIRPERDTAVQTRAPAQKAAKPSAVIEQGLEASASTPEQVKTALIKSGLNSSDNGAQYQDNRTQKALQAYSQTREQLNQNKLDNLITRVDYFA